MPDREAFFASIRERPDDDAPRLVYADWLDENGESAHAELIRVQCELARLPASNQGLSARENELLSQLFGQWYGPSQKPPECHHVQVQRGFISELVCTCGYYQACEGLWCNHAPALRIGFTGGVDADGSLSQLGHLAKCTSLANWVSLKLLGLSAEAVGDGFHKLVQSPQLTHLNQIEIQSFDIGADGLLALAHSTLTHCLQILRLSLGILSEDELRAGAGDDAICLMLANSHSPKLLRLGLNGIITNQGADGLFSSSQIANLRELFLAGDELGSPTICALTRSPYVGHLECLKLRDVVLSENDARLLSNWLDAVPLTELNIANAMLSVEGTRVLCGRPSFKNVKSLYLDGMTDEAVLALTSSGNLAGLKELTLWWDMRDMRLWTDAPPPPRMTTASAIALASCPHLSNLQSLCIGQGDFEDAAVWAITNSPFLRSLKESPFWSAESFGKAAIRRLRARFGHESVVARSK